jgi:hypothetical protein
MLVLSTVLPAISKMDLCGTISPVIAHALWEHINSIIHRYVINAATDAFPVNFKQHTATTAL